MKFTPLALEGLYLIQLEPYSDERGFFARTFCQDEFSDLGLPTEIKQENISYNNRKGILRGMHFQEEPYGEAKLVRLISGLIFDVVVDLRPDSKTYCQWYGHHFDAMSHEAIFIPSGMAHGFLTLTKYSILWYSMFERFHPEVVRGVRYDDPIFNIQWPSEILVISEKDRSWPNFIP